jgi:Fe-S-cluster containining protein
MITQTKPAREDLKKGQILCEFCTAKCCKYFALPIDTPAEFADFEFIRWFILHERATVFTEDETWYLLVHTVCRHLMDDNRCGIYETRPNICREYSTDNCEYEDNWTYDRYFETPEQVKDYTDAMFAKPGSENFRSARPALLPILRQN